MGLVGGNASGVAAMLAGRFCCINCAQKQSQDMQKSMASWTKNASAQACTHAQTTQKHNASSPIYRMNRGIKTTIYTRLTALCPGLPRWAGTRKVKPIWILLEQETVSGSGISWAICKSASRSRQITMPASHHSFFYRQDALPAAQPTASKHWRQQKTRHKNN